MELGCSLRILVLGWGGLSLTAVQLGCSEAMELTVY